MHRPLEFRTSNAKDGCHGRGDCDHLNMLHEELYCSGAPCTLGGKVALLGGKSLTNHITTVNGHCQSSNYSCFHYWTQSLSYQES